MKNQQLYVKLLNKPGFVFVEIASFSDTAELGDLLRSKIPGVCGDVFFKTSTNKIVNTVSELPYANNNFITVVPRVRGGKGGYGTLMKNQAIHKRRFNNTYAARDLNGRKIGDVKNEIKLKKWLLRRTELKRGSGEDSGDKSLNRAYDKNRLRSVAKILTDKRDFVDTVSKWNSAIEESIVQGLKSKNTLQTEKSTKEYHDVVNEGKDLQAILKKISHQFTAKQSNSIEGPENPHSKLQKSYNQKENSKNIPQAKVCINTPDRAFTYELFDAQKIQSYEDVLLFDPEDVKNHLKAIGAKCGGTVAERAKRLWDIHCHPELLKDKRYSAISMKQF